MCEAGIVVVTYESEAEIGPCLDCVLNTGAEIVVVDNASTDRTFEEAARRGVRVITNPRNLGFAAAVNQGIRALEAPFILLLNPDARFETGLEAMVECCRAAGVAGAGGKLLGRDGRPQTGFAVRSLPTPAALIFECLLLNRIWPRNPVNWHYRCLGFDFSAPADVEQPAGAFLMIRRDVWRELNGFDERFFPLWFEDVDFCWRAIERGYRMRYTPNAVANHTGAHSVRKISLENRQLYWYRSLLGFAVTHYRPSTARVVCAAVFFGSLPRMLLGALTFRGLAPVAVYSKVIALAGKTFIRCTVV